MDLKTCSPEEHSIRDVLGQAQGVLRLLKEGLRQEDGEVVLDAAAAQRIERHLTAIKRRLADMRGMPSKKAAKRKFLQLFRELVSAALNEVDRENSRALEAAGRGEQP